MYNTGHDDCAANSQFTCDNGDCVSLERKCDRYHDCSDGSDEIDCGTRIITSLASLFEYHSWAIIHVYSGTSFSTIPIIMSLFNSII